jgi:hypothetical protein
LFDRRNQDMAMASQLILEFTGVGLDEYRAVNAELGIDADTGEGDWPAGMLRHTAGTTEDGRFVVSEIWETRDQQAEFMESRLGAALAAGGINEPPSSVTWIDIVADHDFQAVVVDEEEDEEEEGE